jgi:methylthioribose-1-phosphate isomerase
VDSVWYDDDGVGYLDQRALPRAVVRERATTVDAVVDAIRTLAVRGAPAIGIAAAMGMALAVAAGDEYSLTSTNRVDAAKKCLDSARPTAVNLSWATSRMVAAVRDPKTGTTVRELLRAEADRILAEDREMCRLIGEHGASLIPHGARVITHCNAGALATGGIGTALAAIYTAVAQGKRVEVYADETRPLLQGSRLTAWELRRAGIPVTVLVDGAAAALIRERAIDLCIVGADRIALNGDSANKIGTYSLAIVAAHHGIAFYVAAPTSTFDFTIATGDAIQIEQRSAAEVRSGFGTMTAPCDADIYNPAFDVTPASLITAIVSDRGVHRAPYDFSNAS